MLNHQWQVRCKYEWKNKWVATRSAENRHALLAIASRHDIVRQRGRRKGISSKLYQRFRMDAEGLLRVESGRKEVEKGLWDAGTPKFDSVC